MQPKKRSPKKTSPKKTSNAPPKRSAGRNAYSAKLVTALTESFGGDGHYIAPDVLAMIREVPANVNRAEYDAASGDIRRAATYITGRGHNPSGALETLRGLLSALWNPGARGASVAG